MFDIEYHRIFVKKFRSLPVEIKQKAINLEEIFRKNPFHHLLKTKPLNGHFSHLYSFRITREYRIVFGIVSKDQIVFYNVGHRKDIYRS